MTCNIIIWISIFLLTTVLRAQPITITKLVIIPKQNKHSQPVNIYPNQSKKAITLTYEQNDFYIYFQATDIPPPYAFRLKGYVNYELHSTNQYAFFTNIPSGDYEFTVRSTTHPALPAGQIKLRIESPIWLRWWFLPLLFFYGLILISILFYFLYRYRLRQFKRVHAIRENIARDLHDDMGSYLSSISVLSQSVMNLVHTNPPKAEALLQKIGETARQVMDSMDDIIWSINPNNDSMVQIGVRMRVVGADLLEGADIIFTFDLDDTLLQSYLPLEKRRDFFLIYKETLNNIVKYAQASHVWVWLKQRDSTLELVIKDDGVGFDMKQSVRSSSIGGNGLKNMQSRADKMGGSLIIKSELEHGTIVVLQLLLS